jgi:hypothetical protein
VRVHVEEGRVPHLGSAGVQAVGSVAVPVPEIVVWLGHHHSLVATLGALPPPLDIFFLSVPCCVNTPCVMASNTLGSPLLQAEETLRPQN